MLPVIIVMNKEPYTSQELDSQANFYEISPV